MGSGCLYIGNSVNVNTCKVKPHVKEYLKGFNYTVADYIPCEVCNSRAVDIHHINARGMGGSNVRDILSNLMALCRECHVKYGDKKEFRDWLQDIHDSKLNETVNAKQ